MVNRQYRYHIHRKAFWFVYQDDTSFNEWSLTHFLIISKKHLSRVIKFNPFERYHYVTSLDMLPSCIAEI